MKVLKIIGAIIGLIVLVALIVGLTSPTEGSVERSIVVNANPSQVFKEVNSFKNFNQWSPWFTIDPETKYTYEGPDSGMGAKMSWTSEHPDVGSGAQSIVKSDPNKLVTTQLDFGFQGGYFADFIIEEAEGGTNLTWAYRYEDLNLISALFTRVLSVEDAIGKNYDDGLKALKEYIESKPKSDIEIMEVEPISYLGINTQMSSPTSAEIGAAMGNNYGQIMGYMKANSIEMKGQPLTVYVSMESDNLSMTSAIPVDASTSADHESIEAGQTFGGKAAKAIHKGDYRKLPSTYEKLNEYLSSNNYSLSGKPYEVYITDPTVVTDTAEWVTHIFYPIAND